MGNAEQMVFDFSGSNMKPMDIKRALLGWLLTQKPDGLAVSVPTRFSKYRVDIAAFWSSRGRRRLRPAKTALIEILHDRKSFWPSISGKDDLHSLLKEKKALKAELETRIRSEEPYLRDSDMLFEDMENWDYKSSHNKEYHKCLKEMEKIEKAVYKGSRFERLRAAGVADCLYLAAPAGSVRQHDMAEGWGLLYVAPDMGVSLICEAECRPCKDADRLHLIQNIAASAKSSVLFSFGVRETAGPRPGPEFTPVPRRRRSRGASA